ncbi:MAG: 30S ribosomal protein S1 [Actinomycetota bacterium]|nr:30S ribosomal protein S1 [Actinomycetota bacterium]
MTTNENDLATTGEELADALENAPVSPEATEITTEVAPDSGDVVAEIDSASESLEEVEAVVEETEAVTEAVEVVEETEAVVEAVESVEETEVVAEAAAEIDAPSVPEDAVVEPPPVPRGERPAITAPKEIAELPDDLSADEFAKAIEQTVFEFKEGDIVGGTVVRIDKDEVLVDIGYKSEGVIPLKELSIRNAANPSEIVTVGEEIEALVLQKEDDDGRLVLSKKRAQYERAWGRIERVMNEGGTVTGPVIEVVKGGLIVDIGLRGFLPASLVDLRRVRDLQPFIGEAIEAKVIELDRNRNNVVLSRRAYLEEEQAEQRHAFLADLKPGDVRDGVVSSVVNFGSFVDLGGMDGLVHVSELSWQHVNHPGEVVSVGDKVTVRVLEVDYDRERISLSIRQTTQDPWEQFIEASETGDVLEGAVTKTVPFGAFVSVGEGVEGLVHVSEIAMHHVESPELELSIGQEVKVKVTEVDVDRRRVSLSIKQALPEWEERSTWTERKPSKPRRREFQREDEAEAQPSFNADASLEAILQELKERGIGRS